jgi:hypothetical protein
LADRCPTLREEAHRYPGTLEALFPPPKVLASALTF